MKRMLPILVLALLLVSSCEEFVEQPPAQDPDPLSLKYLEYSDFYDGWAIALKFDITNNSELTIDHFRLDITITYKYGDGSQTFYPDVDLSIQPGATEYSYWIPVCEGMVFYSSHVINAVDIWYTDESHIQFNPQ